MVPYPIVPARRDARVRGQDPFKHTPPVPTIGSQPVDGPSRYDLDRGASFVEQRRILDRALSTADHDDVPSLETAEIPVLGGMRDQLWRQLSELFWPVGIVVDSDRHHEIGRAHI